MAAFTQLILSGSTPNNDTIHQTSRHHSDPNLIALSISTPMMRKQKL